MNSAGKYPGWIYKYTVTKEGDDFGKPYVGATNKEKSRRQSWNKPGGDYAGKKLKEARKIYNPKTDWSYEVLEYNEFDTEEELLKWLDEREEYYIAKFDSRNNGFNTSKGGTGNKGCKHTEATRKKISENHRNYQTEEVKAKISKSNMGREVSQETRAKISAGNTGKKRTAKQKKAQSESRKGQIPEKACEASKEWHKNNPGGWWGNHPVPDEVKAKQKAIQQARGTKVKAISKEGDVKVFPTMLDAAKAFGINVGSVANGVKSGNVLNSIGYRFEKISIDEYNKIISAINTSCDNNSKISNN